MVLKMLSIESAVSWARAHGSVHSIATEIMASKSGTRKASDGVLFAIDRTQTAARRLWSNKG